MTQNNDPDKSVVGAVIAIVKFSESPNLCKFPVTCTVCHYRRLCCALHSIHIMYSLYTGSCVSNLQPLFSLFKPFQYTWRLSWHFLFLCSP